MNKLYLLLFLLSSTSLFAQPGAPDPTFNGNGKFAYDFGNQDNLQCVTVQPNDQKIVTAGTALTAAFAGKLIVMRHHTDGTLDESFDGDGMLMIEDFTESYAYACHVGTDGKIIIAGAAADPTYQFSSIVLRFNEDGSLDDTFGDNGIARHELSPLDDFAYNMAVQNDGKIVIAGTAIDDMYRNVPTVARLLENGDLDPDFGVAGIAQISVSEADNKFYDVKIDSQNRIVACGHIGLPLTNTGQFNFDVMVARFLNDGSIDENFGSNGIVITPISDEYVETAFALAITNADKIVVAGYTTLIDFSFDAALLQYDANGSLDVDFGDGGIQTFQHAVQDVFYDVTIDANNNILAGGTSGGFFMDDRDFLLLRLLPNGSPDNTFSDDGMSLESVLTSFDEANAMTIQDDGRIIMAGKTNNGSNNDVAVMRYLISGADNVQEQSTAYFQLWPNPASGAEYMRIGGVAVEDISEVMLYNQTGQLVFEEKNIGSLGMIKLPAQIGNGQYVLSLHMKNGKSMHLRVMIMPS